MTTDGGFEGVGTWMRIGTYTILPCLNSAFFENR